MDILKELNELHDKWDAKGGKSGSDKYEDDLYDCINELADLIIKYKRAQPAIDAKDMRHCTFNGMCSGVNVGCLNCEYFRTTLSIQPTIDLAKDFSKERVEPFGMIDKPYFVILNREKEGFYTAMVDDDGVLEMFESETKAIVAGNKNPMGSDFGFEVFEIGGGVY